MLSISIPIKIPKKSLGFLWHGEGEGRGFLSYLPLPPYPKEGIDQDNPRGPQSFIPWASVKG